VRRPPNGDVCAGRIPPSLPEWSKIKENCVYFAVLSSHDLATRYEWRSIFRSHVKEWRATFGFNLEWRIGIARHHGSNVLTASGKMWPESSISTARY
jgi:hypothetical protein